MEKHNKYCTEQRLRDGFIDCVCLDNPDKEYIHKELLITSREKLDLSLSQAAKKVGCTKPHLHDIEKGKSCNPSVAILKGFVRVYGLTPKQILDIF